MAIAVEDFETHSNHPHLMMQMPGRRPQHTRRREELLSSSTLFKDYHITVVFVRFQYHDLKIGVIN